MSNDPVSLESLGNSRTHKTVANPHDPRAEDIHADDCWCGGSIAADGSRYANITAPEGQWALARGFDMLAPHWDDLDELTRTMVTRVVGNMGSLLENAEQQVENVLRNTSPAAPRAPDAPSDDVAEAIFKVRQYFTDQRARSEASESDVRSIAYYNRVGTAIETLCRAASRSQPAAPEPSQEKALEDFTAWFLKNYPGSGTILHDPEWHAPKIFRAAMYSANVGGLIVARGAATEAPDARAKERAEIGCAHATDCRWPVCSCDLSAGSKPTG